MIVASWNVNGLRAAVAKGLHDHVRALSPDVLLLQEIRSTPGQLGPKHAKPRSWHVAWHPDARKGYAGTAIWSRRRCCWRTWRWRPRASSGSTACC